MQCFVRPVFCNILNRDDFVSVVIVGYVSALVGEVHIFEIDRTVLHMHHRILRIYDIRLLLKYLADSLRARGGHRDHNEDEREHHQGKQNIHDIRQKRGQFAGCHSTLHDKMRTHPGNRNDAEINDQCHHRHIQDDKLLCLCEHLIELLRRLCKFLSFIIFADKCLDDPDCGDVFLNAGV